MNGSLNYETFLELIPKAHGSTQHIPSRARGVRCLKTREGVTNEALYDSADLAQEMITDMMAI